MIDWLNDLRRLAEADQRCVLVTVAGTRGSTPREVGAKMIVTESQTFGTIGGGQLEYQCIQSACEWLRREAGEAGRSRLQRFTLGANCGQCCGGVAEILFEETGGRNTQWIAQLAALADSATPLVMVTARQSRTVNAKLIVTADSCIASGDELPASDALLGIARQALVSGASARQDSVKLASNVELPVLIEPVQPGDFHIVLFGAGHVGSACASVLSTLDARIDLVDSRPGLLAGRYPAGIRAIPAADPAAVVDLSPAASLFLVMTHDHALDFDICAHILQRADFAYCGLIGSVSKRRRFEKRFRTMGLSEQQIGRLTCPIGIDAISGKKPEQIAIAVAAQLLQLREQGIMRDIDRGNSRFAAAQPGSATGERL